MKEEKSFLKKNRNRLWVWGIIILIMILIAIQFFTKVVPYVRVANTYKQAEELIAQEKFSEASGLLRSIYENDDYSLSRYKDTASLLKLCNSHLAYDCGDIETAYEQFNITDLRFHMDHQTEEQRKAIREYCEKLEAAYKPIAEEKARKEEEELLKKISSDVPYVGMLEAYIGDTILGEPSPDVKTREEYIDWKNCITRTYEFYDGDRFIFSAKCSGGAVISVWDRRDYPDPPTSTKSPQSGSESDPYHASSYRTAESFYEANYDKFFCYEDAASYYYEHRND